MKTYITVRDIVSIFPQVYIPVGTLIEEYDHAFPRFLRRTYFERRYCTKGLRDDIHRLQPGFVEGTPEVFQFLHDGPVVMTKQKLTVKE